MNRGSQTRQSLCLTGEPEHTHVTKYSSYRETDTSQDPLVTNGPNPQGMVLSGVLESGRRDRQSRASVYRKLWEFPLVCCTGLSTATGVSLAILCFHKISSLFSAICNFNEKFDKRISPWFRNVSMFISESSLHPPFA